jgi:hypothetical protein
VHTFELAVASYALASLAEFAVWEYAADSGGSARKAMAAPLIERGAELTPLAAAALGRWNYLASCPLDSSSASSRRVGGWSSTPGTTG